MLFQFNVLKYIKKPVRILEGFRYLEKLWRQKLTWAYTEFVHLAQFLKGHSELWHIETPLPWRLESKLLVSILLEPILGRWDLGLQLLQDRSNGDLPSADASTDQLDNPEELKIKFSLNHSKKYLSSLKTCYSQLSNRLHLRDWNRYWKKYCLHYFC